MPCSAEHVLPGVLVVQMAGTFFCQEKHFRARSTAPRQERRRYCPPRKPDPSMLHTSDLGCHRCFLAVTLDCSTQSSVVPS